MQNAKFDIMTLIGSLSGTNYLRDEPCRGKIGQLMADLARLSDGLWGLLGCIGLHTAESAPPSARLPPSVDARLSSLARLEHRKMPARAATARARSRSMEI